MNTSLLTQLRNVRRLEGAWKSVRSNGISSKSDAVRNEIRKFDEDAPGNLRSLKGRLGHGSFKFAPARGVPIRKPGKKDIRPIVLADVEARIVQRAILDVLQSIEKLQPYFRNPYSFGGIKRHENSRLAAVPAAIQAVLDSIGAGARYVACADISGFFMRISKSAVGDIIAKAVDDDAFMELFRQAIHVELNNLTALREHAERFPTEDIGVAQGSALSPLLGNIILADFDAQMNKGDCRCIRYIDDFIVLGPTEAAVMARLRAARRILDTLGMTFALDKTSSSAIPITNSFEFLGIEIHNGLIRPAGKARAKFLASVKETFDQGRKALIGYRNGHPLEKSQALLGTLKRVDGTVQGWGKHYRFCTDPRCFQNLDVQLAALIGNYLGVYTAERKAASAERAPLMLGVQLLSSLEMQPFEWPKIAGRLPSTRRGTS